MIEHNKELPLRNESIFIYSSGKKFKWRYQSFENNRTTDTDHCKNKRDLQIDFPTEYRVAYCNTTTS